MLLLPFCFSVAYVHMKDSTEFNFTAIGLCVGFFILCKILMDLTAAVQQQQSNTKINGGGSGKSSDSTGTAETSMTVSTHSAISISPPTVSPTDKRSIRGENLYGKPPKVRLRLFYFVFVVEMTKEINILPLRLKQLT